MLCLSLVYSYMYTYVFALIVCTLLLIGNRGIYLSIYLTVQFAEVPNESSISNNYGVYNFMVMQYCST